MFLTTNWNIVLSILGICTHIYIYIYIYNIYKKPILQTPTGKQCFCIHNGKQQLGISVWNILKVLPVNDGLEWRASREAVWAGRLSECQIFHSWPLIYKGWNTKEWFWMRAVAETCLNAACHILGGQLLGEDVPPNQTTQLSQTKLTICLKNNQNRWRPDWKPIMLHIDRTEKTHDRTKNS
jgi:hypothetical protein